MIRSMIPPSADWFNPASFYCVPPDDGVIYSAMSKIVFIPAKKGGEPNSNIKTFELNTKLLAFSPAPDFATTKRLAVLDADLWVTVFNFETEKAIQGHKGHETGELRDKSKKITGAIVFLQQNAVISTVRSTLVYYDLNTNRFTFYHEFTKTTNPFTVFKQSPKEPNLLAGGRKDGSVVIVAVDRMQIVRTFRGHSKEISCMEWRYLPMREPKEEEDEKEEEEKEEILLKEEEKASKNPSKAAPAASRPPRPANNQPETAAQSLADIIASTDTTEAFDLYEDRVEEEFGVSTVKNKSGDKEEESLRFIEKLANAESFDYSEECLSIKADMLQSQSNREGEPLEICSKNQSNFSDQSKTTFEDNKERYGVKNPDKEASENESLLSNASSSTPDLTEESLNEAVSQAMRGAAVKNEIAVLATAAREHQAFVWDAMGEELQPLLRITWNSKVKNHFPEAFANITFIKDDVILMSNGFGMLEEHKIEFNAETRSMKIVEKVVEHFEAKAVLNIGRNAKSDILWTSSIFRTIHCFKIDGEAPLKLVELDTIQPAIHFMKESPHDPNQVAIVGTDKRICIWNTSETDFHALKLRSWIHKSKNTILCVAWHPDDEQTLAFSTRDGQVCLLDTSKPNNAPKYLKNVSGSGIYQIAWAKMNDKPILVCLDSKKLYFYKFPPRGSKQEIDTAEIGKDFTAFAVSENILVASKKDVLFVFDVNKKFELLDEMSMSQPKNIGVMTWFEDRLIVAQESDLYSIRNIKKQVKAKEAPLEDDFMNLLDSRHQKRINSVAFNSTGKLLISADRGSMVHIMNMDTEPGMEETIASICIEMPAFCAIFMPSNEDLVVCGGKSCTPLTFKWKKYEEKPDELIKKESALKGIVWGERTSFVVRNGQKVMVKNKVKAEELAKAMEQIRLNGDASAGTAGNILQSPLSSQPGTSNDGASTSGRRQTTFFDAMTWEITNGAGLALLKNMLNNQSHSPGIIEVIFAPGLDGVNRKLENEREKCLSRKTNQGILFAQLNEKMVEEIEERIKSNKLTETHVAVAPAIHPDLWKRAASAYAKQCLLNGDTMAAIPHLIAVDDIRGLINELCDRNMHREAFVIAKIRTVTNDEEFSDNTLASVVDRWSKYLISTGQFEAAAAVLTCFGKYKEAHEALLKRSKKDQMVTDCILLLQGRIAAVENAAKAKKEAEKAAKRDDQP